MENKQCSKCKQIKSSDLFHRDNRKRNGRASSCKACQTINDKKYWKKIRSKKKQAISRKDMEIIRELKYSTGDEQFLKEDLTYLYIAKKILDEWKSIRYESNNAQRVALLKYGEALCTKCGYVKSTEEFKKRILEASIMCKKCENTWLKINKAMLSDAYVKGLLAGDGLSKSDIPESLIKAKRQEQQLKRIIKKETI